MADSIASVVKDEAAKHFAFMDPSSPLFNTAEAVTHRSAITANMNGLQDYYAESGLNPIPEIDVRREKLSHTCDYCGSAEATKKCGACQCAWYCDGACQKSAWKGGSGTGHKRQCSTLQQTSLDDAAFIVATMADVALPFNSRCCRPSLNQLDSEPCHAAAASSNLYPLMSSLLSTEAATYVSHGWTDDNPSRRGDARSFLHAALCSLFRGDRKVAGSAFGKMDPVRMLMYVESDGGDGSAWRNMFGAAAAYVVAARNGRCSGGGHAAAHRFARDVWNTLNLVFVHEKVMASILGTAEGASFTVGVLKETLKVAAGLPDSLDPNSVVDANVNQAAALVAIWAKRLGLKIDPAKEYKLKGQRKAMYENMAVSMALQHLGRKGKRSVEMGYRNEHVV